MNIDLEIKLRQTLQERLERLDSSGGPLQKQERWTECLESSGARRLGRITGMIVDKPEGYVRVVDPLMNGGNHGFVEMPEEVAEMIVVLGVP